MKTATNVVPLVSVAIEFSPRFWRLGFLATASPIWKRKRPGENSWFDDIGTA
ncbi:MAG: hypothetical protein QG671_1095 [Actinomycetota bacterium]|nr:hypothetical protein [Actinomycetota bacterium]